MAQPSLTYSIGEAQAGDLPACGQLARAVFRNTDYHKILRPERLHDASISEEDRGARFASGLAKEAQTGHYTHLKACTDDGDTIGFATFEHQAKANVTTREGGSTEEPSKQAAQQSETCTPRPIRSEIDESASDRLNVLFSEASAAHSPKPHWFVQRLLVSPAHERKGVGSALLLAGLGKMAALDPSMPVIVVSSTAGKPVYQRAGFVLLREVEYFEDAEDEATKKGHWYLMCKAPSQD